MTKLLDELIEAHGGRDALDGIEAFDVEVDAGGFAFTSHRLPGRFSLRMRVSAHEPRTEFFDLFGSGRDGLFTPERTQLGDEVRDDPTSRLFHDLKFDWDELDFVYFVGYASWNYFTTPWMLALPGVELEELPGRRLRATFPPSIPTHSRRQTFHLAGDGTLARLDYTAEVFGRWARAAHACREPKRFGPVVAPTRRRVTPRVAGRPMPGPTLVWIELRRLEPSPRARP